MSPFTQFDQKTAKNIDLWLNGHFDENTKAEVRDLVKNQPKEALDAFYTTLSFGTGGLRGIMGVGSNRMNSYTVRAATQGLANYVKRQNKSSKPPSAFIGYDSRHNSRLFAEEAAKVLAENGIQVFLFADIRPSPLVSFGCRFKKCITGIMITASHNPPQYNGYKVYWKDGGQVLPPHDQGIIEEVNKITDPAMVKIAFKLQHPLISIVREEIDQPYLQKGSQLQHCEQDNKKCGKDLKVIYTSLHGTGITLIPKMLKEWGFTNISYVDKQIIPDGHFPTVKSPNPEEASALTLGIEKLKADKADILIANDPDADRVGVAVKHKENVVLLNGNQISCLCLDHICRSLNKVHKLPQNAAFIKTIGTTELFQAICDEYGKQCFNVLTGFKYIAEKIYLWEDDPKGPTYIFGGEESFGYLLGTLTRDKDGIISAALICEAALQAKLQGKTLVDQLHALYQKHGVFYESLLSLNFDETKEGKQMMENGMAMVRAQLPKSIKGIEVVAIEDFKTSLKTDLKTGKTQELDFPKSNVLLFWLADKSKVMVRPSGTEPKIKLYCGVVEKCADLTEQGIENTLKICQNKAASLLDSIKTQVASYSGL